LFYLWSKFKEMAYTQWKVKAEGYVKTFDNEPAARRQYGKLSAVIEEEGEGWVEFFARSSKGGEWNLEQEFRLGIQDEEEEE